MRNFPDLSFEPLEGRSLLSASPASGLFVSTLPPEARDSDLFSQVTLDRSTYQVGEPVVFRFTMTNITSHDVTVVHGPSIEGFEVTRAGHPIWISNAGLEPQYLRFDALHPHESITVKATWDGRSNATNPQDARGEGPQLKGSFVVLNELHEKGTPTTFTIGVPQITPPQPPAHWNDLAHSRKS